MKKDTAHKIIEQTATYVVAASKVAVGSRLMESDIFVHIVDQNAADKATTDEDAKFKAVDAVVEPIKDMEIADRPANAVAVDETTTEILARLATLRSLGTAAD